MSNNQPDSEADTAPRRLAEALEPSAIDTLLADAKAAGTPIDGADGLLNQMTKAVRARPAGRDDPSPRLRARRPGGCGQRQFSQWLGLQKRCRPRTARSPSPCRATVMAAFDPKIVPKRARRVGQIDELVLSCYARGMSTRDIEAHLLEVYGVKASHELISNITEVVTDEIEL